MKILMLLNFAAPIIGGIAVGQHFGAFDGIAAGLVIWSFIPWLNK